MLLNVSNKMKDSDRTIEDLYRRRYSGFRYGAAAVLGDFDLAHDAVQDGFAQALAQHRDFRGGSLEAWVWRIVHSRAVDLRRRIRRPFLEPDVDLELIHSETDPELAAAVRNLPERRRLVVFLRYFADLPYGTIAEICGASEGTVAATLSQAHDELRKALELEGVVR